MSTWLGDPNDDIDRRWPWWKRGIGAGLVWVLLGLSWVQRQIERLMMTVEDLWIWWRR